MSTEQAEKVQEIVAEGMAREGLQEMVLPAEEAAAQRLADFVSEAAIDRMIADARDAGVSLLDGPGGLIGQLTARVIERALGAEMDDHLGYVKGDPAGNGTGNSRNGSFGKTLTTTSGPVRIAVPRDRKSAFEPQIVVKGQRRVGQVDDMILSLYARGMTTRDIHAHLAEIYGVEVSPALVSAVTDVVSDEITEWQSRPLDAFYAILYIDALVVKVRDGGAVDNKAAYLVTGVDAKNGVKGIQRPVLPFSDLIGDHVGDGRYQCGRNLHPVDFRQVRVNVPRGHPAGVKRQDHVIDLADAPLPFHHDLRLEFSLPVPGHRDPHRPRRRSECLPVGAVAGITRPVSCRVAFHVTQVIVHFRAQRPLDNPGRQLPDQPARTVQQRNAGGLRVSDHLVDRRVADKVRQPFGRGLLSGEHHFLQALARHSLGDDFLHLLGLFSAHSECPLRQRNIRHTGITCTLSHK